MNTSKIFKQMSSKVTQKIATNYLKMRTFYLIDISIVFFIYSKVKLHIINSDFQDKYGRIMLFYLVSL